MAQHPLEDSKKPPMGKRVISSDERLEFGDVVCRLDVLLLAAQRRGLLRDSKDLAARAKVWPQVVDALLANQKREYDMRVLAHLSYALGVGVEGILEYLSPEALKREQDASRDFMLSIPVFHLAEEIPADAVGWGEVHLLLKDRIEERREGWLRQLGKSPKSHLTNREVGERIGLKNVETVSVWRKSGAGRYNRALLARVCFHLQLKKISDLLQYFPSLPPLAHDQGSTPAPQNTN